MAKSKTCKICVLCRKDINDEVKYGKLYKSKNVWVHYYCLLLSETITQSGEDEEGILGFMPQDIRKELERSKSKKCCYCNEMMATLGCVHKHCNRKFHLYCGYINNAMFHFTKFTVHCNLHTKPSNLPAYIKKSLKDYYCLICLDAFHEKIKPSEIYWASCCKSRVLLHITCLRQMALNAGYFTKCPGCNNQTDFIQSIRNWGVFVPERDASWELDRNAFSDLLYVHDKCDVLNCICPDGRNFSDEKGKWKLILCKMCGSVGTHLACNEYKRRFLCDVCTLNREENSTINVQSQPNVCDYKNIQKIENDGNEEEFIEIEIMEPRLEDFFVENENNSTFHSDCENMVPLDNSIVEEQKEISLSERFVDERNLLKRSFQDITNCNDQEFTNSFHKKLKENNDVNFEDVNLLTIKEEYFPIEEEIHCTETVEIEGTSQSIPLDDDSEVEFVSYTKLSTPPKIPLYSNNVQLFLNSVISKPPCLRKHNFHIVCKEPRKAKRKSKLQQNSSSGKESTKVVQLSLENFITRTKVT